MYMRSQATNTAITALFLTVEVVVGRKKKRKKRRERSTKQTTMSLGLLLKAQIQPYYSLAKCI
jgi:hypothetical protein